MSLVIATVALPARRCGRKARSRSIKGAEFECANAETVSGITDPNSIFNKRQQMASWGIRLTPRAEELQHEFSKIGYPSRWTPVSCMRLNEISSKMKKIIYTLVTSWSGGGLGRRIDELNTVAKSDIASDLGQMVFVP